MRRLRSVVNSVDQREPAQYSNFGLSQTKPFTLCARTYCTYFGTQGQVLCSMDAAKSPGLKARGWSLALLDHWKLITSIICNYGVCLVNAWCLVRHVLRTCRVGVRHMSFDSNTVWSPVNQDTREQPTTSSCSFMRLQQQQTKLQLQGRLQFRRCWLKSQADLDTLSLKEYSPRLAVTNMPAKLAVIPATVKAMSCHQRTVFFNVGKEVYCL